MPVQGGLSGSWSSCAKYQISSSGLISIISSSFADRENNKMENFAYIILITNIITCSCTLYKQALYPCCIT